MPLESDSNATTWQSSLPLMLTPHGETPAMQTEVVMMTPLFAQQLLDRNTCNRRVRQPRVKCYAGAMLRGEWRLSHQGVAISPTNVMLDGQHRLLAVVASGCTVPMSLTLNAPEDAFQVIDTGLNRSMSDQSRLDSNITQVYAFLIEAHHGKRPDKPSGAQLLALHDKIGEHVDALHDYCPTSSQMFSRASMRSAAVVQSLAGNRKYAFDLYRRLVLGDLDDLPPIAMSFLKQHLTGSLLTGSAGSQATQMILFVKANQLFSPHERNRKFLRYTPQLREEAVKLVRTLVPSIFAA